MILFYVVYRITRWRDSQSSKGFDLIIFIPVEEGEVKELRGRRKEKEREEIKEWGLMYTQWWGKVI